MPDEKQQPKASDILRALHELVLEPEEDMAAKPLKDVQAELAKRGITTSAVTARLKEQLAKARANIELSSARAQRERSLDRLKEVHGTLSRFPAGVRERALTILAGLSAENPAVAAAYFSKFEEASDADLESLLDDLSLLDESDDGKSSTGAT